MVEKSPFTRQFRLKDFRDRLNSHDTIDKKKLFNETKNNNVKAVQKLRKHLQISTSCFVNRAPFVFSVALIVSSIHRVLLYSK